MFDHFHRVRKGVLIPSKNHTHMSEFKPGTVEKKSSSTAGLPVGIDPTSP